MLDIHNVYDATGSTDTIVAENNANAVIPANDGATTIGVSPFANAVLCAYGAVVDAAGQALTTLGLQSNNLPDPTNQLSDSVNTTPTMTSIVRSYFLQIGYLKGPNLVRYANEAAGKTAPFKLDWVAGLGRTIVGSFAPQNPAQYTQVLGTSTAGVYSTTPFAPAAGGQTQTPPIGTYAILGVRAYALTTGAVLRFQHTDFAGCLPGIPVIDYGTGTLTSANQGGNQITSDSWQGYQFVWLSTVLGVPCCPLFTVQGQGTGLNIQCLDTNADTPQIVLNLQKVA